MLNILQAQSALWGCKVESMGIGWVVCNLKRLHALRGEITNNAASKF
jgi:hypothetical protein